MIMMITTTAMMNKHQNRKPRYDKFRGVVVVDGSRWSTDVL